MKCKKCGSNNIYKSINNNKKYMCGNCNNTWIKKAYKNNKPIDKLDKKCKACGYNRFYMRTYNIGERVDERVPYGCPIDMWSDGHNYARNDFILYTCKRCKGKNYKKVLIY